MTKAAEQGHVDAQFSLGFNYYFSKGVRLDYQKAAYWVTKAAEQGDIGAQTFLGGLYSDGEGVRQ